jgi:TATA-box binding protein (TBP) (component of TFIID and TFIIIB)
MSLTTTENNSLNSLNFIPTPIPETMSGKPCDKTEIKSMTGPSIEELDWNSNTMANLPSDMADLMKSASWEFNQVINSNGGTKYGREIDIYALVDDIVENQEEEKNIYDYIEEYRASYDPYVNITPLSVSAQSAKAKMTKAFDLQTLSEVIAEHIIKYAKNKKRKFSILGIFYKEVHEGIIKKPKPRKKGAFPNNMAILIKSPMGTDKVVHMKIFKNGSISMVGCKIKEDGSAVVKILEQFILKQSFLFKSNEEKSKFRIAGFETTMVNSNYSIGFKIDRDRMFTFLQKKYDTLFSAYDPAVYAAVKIGFYYNSIKDTQDGICTCSSGSCTLKKSTAGKGSGNGEGKCKKVTIAVFESGNIVITGGRNIVHANAAYDYINDIIKENAKRFALINLSDIYNGE